MKLKILLLSTLAATAMAMTTSASANSFSIGWGPHGQVSYAITLGQPYVTYGWQQARPYAAPPRHWRRPPPRRVHHHRPYRKNWRGHNRYRHQQPRRHYRH